MYINNVVCSAYLCPLSYLKVKPTFAGLQTLSRIICQQVSRQALLGLFLEGQGMPLNTAKFKSASAALSRFLG